MMVGHTRKIFKASGFSLVEALVTLVVFSFGLLAVAKFQTSLVNSSAQNKARSEAIQLAQQKIDVLRSYTTEPELVANLMAAATTTATNTFPSSVTAGSYPTTAETLTGTNAEFSRQWDVTCSSDICSLVMRVSWDDLAAGTQTVSLETDLTWKDPRGATDLAVNDYEPIVPSATGRAYLGDTTVTHQQLVDDGTNNGDGTSIIGVGSELLLVDGTTADGESSYNVVLTLQDACVSGNNCIDFVKISGRVYRDLVSTPTATLANTFVLASDAAYCARDMAHTVTTSPNHNYEYFDYTCYLGGGWHGNIGLALSGAGNRDQVCLGDPTSPVYDDDDSTNNWRQMELASRRVYRGMTFIGDASSPAVLPTDTRYYSQGIADSAILPDPGDLDGNGALIANTDYRYYGHDFVVTYIRANNPTGTDCTASLTLPDTDTNSDSTMGDLFYGVSTDFVCLNSERVPGTFKYLDTLATGHWAKNSCPYDPSRGPALAYIVSGTVTVPSPDLLTGSAVLNSANPDNCSFVTSLADLNALTALDVSDVRTAEYACVVYDWGEGWTGTVDVAEGFGIDCPGPLSFPAITGNQTNQDFACVTLAQPTISGTITATYNDLTGSVVEAIRTNADSTETTVPCTVNVTETGTATYGCTVAEETLNGGWIGRVVLTPPTDFSCTSTTHPYSTAVTEPGLTGQDFSCTGPIGKYTLSGTALNAASPAGDMYTGTTIVDSAGNSCNPTPAVNNKDVNYSCVVTYDRRVSTTWSGSITITPPSGYWCGTTTAASTTSVSVTSSTTLSNISCERSGTFKVSVLIDDLVTPDDTYLNYYINGSAVTLTDLSGTVVATRSNGCSWIWANGGTDTQLDCTSPLMRASAQWSGYFSVPPFDGYKLCPGDTIDLINLQPGNTYGYTLKSVATATACP